MLKALKYTIAGIWFGIILTKSEAASWFRIQEMFLFESFHMYGIIGSAIVVGVVSLLIIRLLKIKTVDGQTPNLDGKELNKGTVIGGLLFGFGWALTGACPGPIFVQMGNGYTIVIVTFLFAVFGAWTYAWLKPKLPH